MWGKETAAINLCGYSLTTALARQERKPIMTLLHIQKAICNQYKLSHHHIFPKQLQSV